MPNDKAVIRYFSGTGNTKRVAERIAQAMTAAGDLVDIAAIPAPPPEAAGRYVFLCPVYALGLPRVVRRYLTGLPRLASPQPAMLVVTAGNPGHTGWALRHGRELLDARNIRVSVSETIHMPDNWTPFLPAPSEDEARELLVAGDALASQLARDFMAGRERHRPFSLRSMGPVASWLVHHGFHAIGIHHMWCLFRATKACTACGLCARTCPMGAISMAGGRPKWSRACEQCCRCFNLCPARAIGQLDIVGRGSKRARYLEPGFIPQ